MKGLYTKMKQSKPRSRILAAVLACVMVLSAAVAVLYPLWDEAAAAAPVPGTKEYYIAHVDGKNVEGIAGLLTTADQDLGLSRYIGAGTQYETDEPVVVGQIQIEKKLEMVAEEDETFLFQVDYLGQGEEPGEVMSTMYARIDIPAGQQNGYAVFNNQQPGWYTVTELDSNWRFEPDGQLTEDNPDATVDETGNSVTRWVD